MMAPSPRHDPYARKHDTLPAEICRGAFLQALLDGQAPSESRVEAILERLERAG